MVINWLFVTGVNYLRSPIEVRSARAEDDVTGLTAIRLGLRCLAFRRVTPALSAGVKLIKSRLMPMDLAISSSELHGMLGGDSLVFARKW